APCTSAPAVRPVRCRVPASRPQTVQAQAVQSDNGKVQSRAKQLKFYYFDPLNPEEVREIVARHRDTPKSHQHAAANGNGNGYLTHVKDSGRDPVQLQRLSTQLEETRSALVKLQQFEGLYKESRMRSKQMQAEVTSLQVLLADKDAELARQYKRMESEAMERSGLRSSFNVAVDEVKALRNELEEARQAMLELRGVIPSNVTLRRGVRSSGLIDDAGTNPDVLTSLQGLAKQLAEGMEQEVGSMFNGSVAGKREM
ncbi:hypothetical protein TSOC_004969, partial [Tetrabaena socialis]